MKFISRWLTRYLIDEATTQPPRMTGPIDLGRPKAQVPGMGLAQVLCSRRERLGRPIPGHRHKLAEPKQFPIGTVPNGFFCARGVLSNQRRKRDLQSARM